MAAANYNRPKPIDPIWYRLDCMIVISCRCGRSLRQNVEAFAVERGIDSRLRFHEVYRRLRCTKCGKRPTSIDVVRGIS